jgi:hypothetical protein
VVAPQYWLALIVLAAASALHASRAAFDLFALSACAFGLNVVLVAGIVRALFDHNASREPIGALFLTGIAAAGLLAGTVTLIMRIARAREAA